ncbi:hypothetical protein [Phenylobacterium sp.]|uniref:hypothetical protein n=1 Tax=Phenylobacterium sp. TaxID=1871053 RepID=UPI0025E8D64A|nr:hypothetical protein [Phenylobacterium sp.]MCA6346852.1 hypothetical protein [Phenylobacterium sp.]MCA6351709.1 hypothetical protein [Phenylobacterium sp.]MCA6355303.1 hypothetical protein [Phenylobacterium sp.]MCA6358315.1 hypothetical protein [Phenylobacterium sp.]MCA6361192.1 hypothetical protein [Phenylobacterium sp.]
MTGPGLASPGSAAAAPGRIDFRRINSVAVRNGEAVAQAFLPDGRREGREWVARNPRRADRRPGSFKINLDSGKGADFASGDRFSDFVGMVAFVQAISQREAALRLAEALGTSPYE